MENNTQNTKSYVKISNFYKQNIKHFYNLDVVTDRLINVPRHKNITEFSLSLEHKLGLLVNKKKDSTNPQNKFDILRSMVNDTLNDIFNTNDLVHKIDYYKFRNIVKYIIRTLRTNPTKK